MAAPVLLGIVTRNGGAKIVLEYDQALAATTPLVTDYSVLVDAVPNVVTSVTVVGSTVELVPTTVLVRTTTNTLTYVQSVGNEVQNAGLELAADFATQTIQARTLSMAVQPTGAKDGIAFTTQPVININDPVTVAVDANDQTTVVTASIASGTGTLSGTLTKTVVNGVATFTNLKITGADGNFTIAFTTHASVVPVTSASFALTSSDTVTYDSNGATSGTVPVDSSSPYIPGATVTVLSNSGTLAKTGSTFMGWGTRADGGATIKLPAATFVVAGDTTLYAQWTTSILTVAEGPVNAGFDLSEMPLLQNRGPGILAIGNSATNLANEGILIASGASYEFPRTLVEGVGVVYIQAIGDSCDVRKLNVG